MGYVVGEPSEHHLIYRCPATGDDSGRNQDSEVTVS